jgi:hypothetical protein
VLKIGHFRKQIRNTWKVLKCGGGEGGRISVGLIMSKMSKYYIVKMGRNIIHTVERRKCNWIGHILA